MYLDLLPMQGAIVEQLARQTLAKAERRLRNLEAKAERQRGRVETARRQVEWAERQNARLADDPAPVEGI
jgi:multidrug resistance efflux pump